MTVAESIALVTIMVTPWIVVGWIVYITQRYGPGSDDD